MKMEVSAGELAYLMEEIGRLTPENIEGMLEISNEEQAKESERNLENDVRQMLFEGLKKVSKITSDSRLNCTEYVQFYSVMNEIAKTLLDK